MADDTATAVDIVARTVWGEARSCGRDGMHRVMNTMQNRAMHPSWWGRTLSDVCTAPWQYSCRNAGDPNLPKLLAVTMADPDFRQAMALATLAVAGTLPDITRGADSYYALSMARPPYWTARAVHTVSDGWHSFWRVGVSTSSGDADSPNIGHHSPVAQMSADDLNALEIARLGI